MNLRQKRKKQIKDLEGEDSIDRIIKATKLIAESKKTLSDIPFCPIFYPSEEEFQSPMQYIKKIYPKAKDYGICKIVPPKNWKSSHPERFFKCREKFETKLQYLHKLQQGHGHDDGEIYSVNSYKKMCEKFEKNFYKSNKINFNAKNGESDQQFMAKKLSALEKRYWEIVDRGKEMEVEYGSDILSTTFASGFSNKNKDSEWNLNFFPLNKNCLLRYLNEKISGVNVPWVYFGMLFSTFCWHYEDDCLFSISYNHTGAPKFWYGVPGGFAQHVEDVAKALLPQLFEEEPDLMMKLVTMINPTVLMAHSIPVCKSYHNPGEFMITLPRSFHSGFNTGFNIAEAVNFALESWLPFALECADKYASFARDSVIGHERFLICAVRDAIANQKTDVANNNKLENSNVELNNNPNSYIDSEFNLKPNTKLDSEPNNKPPSSEIIEDAFHLRKALKMLIWREKMRSSGIEKDFEREKSPEDDKKHYQCKICNRECYTSFFRCNWHSMRAGCCKHREEFCPCSHVNKRYVIRFNLEDLQAMFESLRYS